LSRPFTAPFSAKPLCDSASFVAMLRMSAGLNVGWHTSSRCPCQKTALSTRHALLCSYTDLYHIRHECAAAGNDAAGTPGGRDRRARRRRRSHCCPHGPRTARSAWTSPTGHRGRDGGSHLPAPDAEHGLGQHHARRCNERRCQAQDGPVFGPIGGTSRSCRLSPSTAQAAQRFQRAQTWAAGSRQRRASPTTRASRTPSTCDARRLGSQGRSCRFRPRQ
jgi:hypothetical protein